MYCRIVLCMVFSVWLCGCSSIEVRHTGEGMLSFEQHAYIPAAVRKVLADARNCCVSLADIPYRSITGEGSQSVKISLDSPAYSFESGKSFFAAFRIAELPRPFMLEVVSNRTAVPGFEGAMSSVMSTQSLIFYPVIMLLDDQFKVQQVLEPADAQKGCQMGSGNPDGAAAYRMVLDIEATSHQASYLIIMTKGAMLAKEGDHVCGQVVHGYSPIGDLSITITNLDFSDGKMRMKSSWTWYQDKFGDGDVGVFAGVMQEPGLLILGDDAIHFLERNNYRYKERLSIPYDQVFYAKALERDRMDQRLALRSFDATGNRVSSHVFDASWAGPHYSAAPLADEISARIKPDARKERIGFSVGASNPETRFLARNGGVAERIGDATVAGGMATAMPCGICQTGLCSPEALVPCAALFSVGAVIGGTYGVGRELFLHMGGTSAALSVSADAKQSVTPIVMAETHKAFDRQALSGCVARELDSSANRGWHDQGRMALPAMSLPDGSGAGQGGSRGSGTDRQNYQYGSETTVSRIDLVSDAQTSQLVSATSVHLQIEGEIVFTDLSRNRAKRSLLLWKSESYPIAEWSAPDRKVVTKMLEEGCKEFARKSVEASRTLWMQ